MQALLLCGGDGTRLRPFTYTQPKSMLPLVNKPLLYYILESFAAAAVEKVVIILGPNGQVIEDLLTTEHPYGLKYEFVYQPEPLGLAHAVQVAGDALQYGPFLMYLGDNLLAEPLRPLIARFEEEKPDALVLLREVKNPQQFGVALLEKGKVVRVEEKPKVPRSNLALVGIYLFSAAIHQAVRRIKPSWRGELEITDAIQELIDQGKTVTSHRLSGWWKDTGSVMDLLEANKYFLKKITPRHDGEVKKSEISGPLVLGKGSQLKNCLIKGPVAIGAGCKISGSVLGPYLSVGDEVEIVNSRISNAIILPRGQIKELSLATGILGERVKVVGSGSKNKDSSLFLGADAVVKF